MPLTQAHILKAVAHARRALRHGDVAETKRWLDLVQHIDAVAARLDKIARAEALRRRLHAAET